KLEYARRRPDGYRLPNRRVGGFGVCHVGAEGEKREQKSDRTASVAHFISVVGEATKFCVDSVAARSPTGSASVDRSATDRGAAHSPRIPAALISGHHLSISAWCKAASACGVWRSGGKMS